ncbi:MAG: BMP family ABC transporter substrate-binding protein [Ruminococcus sp.]|nr:BMP family ABC transporter substrate-binding protein [Ruminococcus sp.]
MKKILALLLVCIFTLSLVACDNDVTNTATNSQTQPSTEPAPTMKVAVLMKGSEDDPTAISHVKGIKDAAKELNISTEEMSFEYLVETDDTCYDKIAELSENEYEVIISTDYNHQSYMEQAAKEFPKTTFVAISGDTAKDVDRSNFFNAYTYIFESRYVAGVVAGMKIKELDAEGLLSKDNYNNDGNVKIGYVGTSPSAAVKSSYTAFYLGVKSVFENVSMAVQYTNKSNDAKKDEETAKYLISQGCVVIGQHSTTDGVAKAVDKALEGSKKCYCVGYLTDLTKVSAKGALTSSTHVWSVYYKELLNAVFNDEKLQQDWADGYVVGAVDITKLSDCCAKGTKEEVKRVVDAIKAEKLHVFNTSTFTVEAEKINAAYAIDTDGDEIADEYGAIFDGYFHESYFRSAPYFALDIDGISVLN